MINGGYIPQGWQCGVCGRVNAPHVAQCPCGPSKYTISSNSWDKEDKYDMKSTEIAKLFENSFCNKCGKFIKDCTCTTLNKEI